MRSLLETLPGLPMSVGELTTMVRHMWESDTVDESAALNAFRASQMNLVLHFGTHTTSDEASGIFESAIRFAQRYPCRIIVLCPHEGASADVEEPLEAKLFSQCYLGPRLRELCCCEGLMLSYPLTTSELLDHIVSLWLETDLPVYHWFHRVPTERIDKYYRAFLHRSQCVLFDRAVEGDSIDHLTLPDGTRIVDLAQARLLPIRQNIGQFLSNFAPHLLVGGLERVAVKSVEDYHGESVCLLRWMRQAIESCAKRVKEDVAVEYETGILPQGNAHTLEVDWRYEDKNRFLRWHYNAREQTAALIGDLGSGHFHHPLHIEALAPEQSLAEALLFF